MHSCPLCTAAGSDPFPLSYSFLDRSFSGVQCRSCGFIRIEPRPTPDELSAMYSDEYFLHDGADCGAHSGTDYETAAKRGSVKFPEILGHIRARQPSGSFFEVGCGMGYFLDYARSQGYEVSGIEYAALGAETCRTRFGLDVARASLEEYDPGGKKFDVVFLGDVLEHLVDPLAMAAKCRSLLRPGGILAVEVPSMFNSFVGRVAVRVFRTLGRSKNMPMPPYHVNEFVPRTLRSLFSRAGFGKISIVQRIKSPSSITLRGAWYERWGKLVLQYPNVLLTRSVGVCGDRLLGIGQNPVTSQHE